VAGTKGCVCNIAFGGVNPTAAVLHVLRDHRRRHGATLTTDGIDAVQAHFQNTENAPVEETEANYPVRILRYELIENSEGGGRHRGGLGVRRDYTFPGHAPSFSILSDKARFAPWGLFGGEAARPAKYILNPETQQSRELPSKITFQLAPGDVVSVQTPGGGGTPVAARAPAEDVARDVALGRSRPSVLARLRRGRGTGDAGSRQRRHRPPSERGGPDERAADRHRHRRHLHRRRAGRRRDGRHPRRQGAHDPEDPRRASWPRSSAASPSARRVAATWPPLVHATTVATNAIIEGKTARVGMR